jgi:transcriptional regulator with GAF, ATPase, and Fis domain
LNESEEIWMVVLTREQLEDRLAALHQASLELVSDLSLQTVLERIAQTAQELVGAQYAALGVVDENGELIQFIPVGMTLEEVALIPHRPEGKGLLGLFRSERCTIRISDISLDPRSVGFPPNHPAMHSLLGVPILSGDQMLGQLYLSNKQNYTEFTKQDEHAIETLAAYAAVAISNARLYSRLLEREQALTQHNEDLSLLNDAARTLARSLDVDEILDKTLNRVMIYLSVEAGEIFLMDDSKKELRLAIHRGDFSDPFALQEFFRLGEGFIGMVAATIDGT